MADGFPTCLCPAGKSGKGRGKKAAAAAAAAAEQAGAEADAHAAAASAVSNVNMYCKAALHLALTAVLPSPVGGEEEGNEQEKEEEKGSALAAAAAALVDAQEMCEQVGGSWRLMQRSSSYLSCFVGNRDAAGFRVQTWRCKSRLGGACQLQMCAWENERSANIRREACQQRSLCHTFLHGVHVQRVPIIVIPAACRSGPSWVLENSFQSIVQN